jgi:quinol monooxygenase YgiN
MTPEQVTIIAYLTVPPGTEQSILKRFSDVVSGTRAEPGCINYDFHQHPTEPHRFVFYENVADQAAFEFHVQQSHTQTWTDYVQAHGGHFEVTQWTMLSQPA